MVVKLDISKAYDRVEWDFLREMMRKMQSPEYFVTLIFQCIQLVEFQILINGHPSQAFALKWSLRQGDLFISIFIPYLCIRFFRPYPVACATKYMAGY